MNSRRRKPQDEDRSRPTTVKGPFDTFRSFLASQRTLAPANETIPAFIDWLRDDLGWTGIHMQKDLWCEYVMICQLARFKPIKEKWFGRELAKAGFHPYQLDNRHRGKGPRPMAVDLSEEDVNEATAANNVTAIIAKKATTAITAKPLPMGMQTQKAA